MLNRSSSCPLSEMVSPDSQAKLQQTPDVIQAHTTYPCPPDIFKAVKKPPAVLQPSAQICMVQPEEAPPLEPVYFFDHFEPLDCKPSTEAFIVKVPCDNCDITLEETISAFEKCCKLCQQESNTGSMSAALLNNYQINLLRKTWLRSGRRGSSFDGSFDKDSYNKQKPPFERKTSEFESVASNETKITECDDRSVKKALRPKGSPLKRSHSLGYDKTQRRPFKKFSLPTPESQLKEESPRNNALDSKKVATLYRHYYPEGGWGFVVITCSLLVNILCHGLQMSSGVLITSAIQKFHVDIVYAEPTTKCHCFKCQPPPETLTIPPKTPTAVPEPRVIISAEPDSSSRSTLKGRARSWPLLVQPDGKPLRGNQLGAPSPVAQVRRLLWRHYYPEGGWGYVVVGCAVLVHILNHGLQLAAAVLLEPVYARFQVGLPQSGWLGALSTAVALFLSPVTIAFCRRKSTRVTAVVGGLITALGCLFTSFASQFHQLFFSYGTVIGIGVGLTRDCSTLMVAQYFKRRRELVEIFIVSGSGLGIAVMSACIQGAISSIGWRLGLQAVTGVVFLTFILGTFYRSASLYHPQRRAILHLKNQKRKIKDKNKNDDKPTFLDTTTLRSKTVRILLVSTGLSAFGINTPIFYLARQAEQEGLGERTVLLQTYLGIAWVLGCMSFGLVVVHNSVECRIARQYLCQAAIFMCGLAILALTTVHGNYHGYVLFVWIYGIFCGGYHYSLKMYTYERVRARNFARTWGFVQCSQAIPIALGVPISGYMNEGCGGKAGYYFSSTCTLAGSLAMFLIDVHRRRIARHKHTHANGQRHRCESESCPKRRPSIGGAEPEPLNEQPLAGGEHPIVVGAGGELLFGPGGTGPGEKPELTCISEEGIADMDLPDNLLDDLDYIGITSCNKVENYLMLSEFENNLIAETPVVLDKKGRRWSLARRPDDPQEDGNRWRLVPPKRTITVIDEASV